MIVEPSLMDEEQTDAISKNLWMVRSKSDGDKWYTVNRFNTNVWTCDCPDHHYRQHDCKHINAAANGDLGYGQFFEWSLS